VVVSENVVYADDVVVVVVDAVVGDVYPEYEIVAVEGDADNNFVNEIEAVVFDFAVGKLNYYEYFAVAAADVVDEYDLGKIDAAYYDSMKPMIIKMTSKEAVEVVVESLM
jgi:hypothetical protein